MFEYSFERSENVLTLRRTKAWLASGLVGALLPLTAMGVMGVDKLTLPLFLLIVCGMMLVLYRLLLWGRCLVFDKKSNLFLIDGRKVCALSELISVQLEGSNRSPFFPKMGRLRGLHLRTAQGKVIILKHVWEGNSDYRNQVRIARDIADFVGIN